MSYTPDQGQCLNKIPQILSVIFADSEHQIIHMSKTMSNVIKHTNMASKNQ